MRIGIIGSEQFYQEIELLKINPLWHHNQVPEQSQSQWVQKFNGTLRCIFQPAEEKGNGALKMVEKGIVDDVDYLFGVHLRPKEELELGFAAPSIRHGAAIFLEGKIIGEDTHGARPHLGVNAIEVGYAIQN
jgi:amidohydrolase